MLTPDGLVNEIQDVFEKGMEMASRIELEQSGDRVLVTMHDLANSGMCRSVRTQYPRVCDQLGCPVCNFIGCMVTDATGRKVMKESVSIEGKKVRVSFRLF